MREAMAHCDNRAVRRQERCRRDNIEPESVKFICDNQAQIL